MINIDSKYDIVLTFSNVTEITGHIFECFDYYLILRNKFKVAILFLNSIPMCKLKIAWDSKYIIPFTDVIDDIIYINEQQYNKERIYNFGKNTKVILTDGNILQLEKHSILFKTNKLYGFLCADLDFTQCKLYKNIIYLQDYRLYGKNKHFKSINYVKKIPFQYYKKFSSPKQNIGLMYLTFNCRKITREAVIEGHLQSGCNKTIILVPEYVPEYDNIPNVEQVIAPLDNFFEKFDTYIYTTFTRNLDCSPRLLTECWYYGKKIIIATNKSDLGREIRLNDLKNNFKSLWLTEQDSIFSILSE